MTGKAFGNRRRFPVGQIMTLAAFGHDLSVIIFPRVIDVKFLMAVSTGYTRMCRPVVFQPVVMGTVTASAIGQG